MQETRGENESIGIRIQTYIRVKFDLLEILL